MTSFEFNCRLFRSRIAERWMSQHLLIGPSYEPLIISGYTIDPKQIHFFIYYI